MKYWNTHLGFNLAIRLATVSVPRKKMTAILLRALTQ